MLDSLEGCGFVFRQLGTVLLLGNDYGTVLGLCCKGVFMLILVPGYL